MGVGAGGDDHLGRGARSGSAGAVLVVDDEPLVRALTCDHLQDIGHCCLEAGCANEALIVLENRNDIWFLVTDVNMPGPLNGLGLAWRVAELWPKIGIVVLSGGGHPGSAALPTEAVFLSKPCLHADLVSAVQCRHGCSRPGR